MTDLSFSFLRNIILSGFIIYPLHTINNIRWYDQILFAWPKQEEWDELGMKHVWEQENYIQSFGGETWEKQITLETYA